MTRDPYFYELDISSISGSTVILDIDGTLCADGETCLNTAVAKKIGELKAHNAIYLFSNSPRRTSRTAEIAKAFGLQSLASPYKKPSRKVMESLPFYADRGKVVVIGDKFLTDGLFAKRVGAKFIKVKSLRSKTEPITLSLLYFIDSVANGIFS